MNREPALIIGAIVAVVNVVIIVLKLDPAVAGALVAAATAVGAAVIRSQVTPSNPTAGG